MFWRVTEFSEDVNFDKYEEVVRIASKKDYLQHLKNQDDEKKALEKCSFCEYLAHKRKIGWVNCREKK